MAIVLEGDGTITGVTTFTTPLDDIKFDSINVTGIATASTFQAGTGVSMASPRSQQIALFTNNVEGLHLDDAGRVGIGTTNANKAADANNAKVVNAGIITANQYYGNQLTAAGVRVTGVSTFAAVTGTTGTFSDAVSGTTGTFSSTVTVSSGNLDINDSIRHIGDTNTKISFSGADTIQLTTGGSARVQVTDAATDITNDLIITDKIVHSGDTNTAIRFPSADTITAETGGSEALRVDSSGRVIIGHNASSGKDSTLQVVGSGGDSADFARYAASEYGPNLHFIKSRNATAGSHTIIQSGDHLGIINFRGSDGSAFRAAAEIGAYVDGTPGSSDMPGRLVFSTTSDGSSGPSERLRIASDSNITQTIDTDGDGFIITTGSANIKPMLTGNSNRSAENNTIFGISGKWNNTEVGRIAFEAGPDTTNKDDGNINLYTRVSGGSLTSRLNITSTGNIGVNQSGPNAKIQLQGASAYVVTSSGRATEGIDVYASGGGLGNYGGAISFGTGSTGRAAIAALQGGSDADNVGLAFFSHPSGTGAVDAQEQMRINSSGQVGINTDATNAQFIVHKNSSNTAITGHNYLATQSGILIQNRQPSAAGQFTAFTGNVSSAGGYTQSASMVIESTATAYSPKTHFTRRSGSGTQGITMTLDAAGEVGIGLTEPATPLHVYHATTNSVARFESGDAYCNIVINDSNSNASRPYLGVQADDFRFVSHDGSNSGEKIRIKNTGGITFNGDTSASNALDDYEEGTWTPDFYYHTSTANVAGHYTKIGRMVYAYFTGNYYSSASNHQYISNLPFTSSNNSGGNGGVARGYQNYDIENGPIYYIDNNTTKIYFYKNNGVNFAASNGDGMSFRGVAIYHTDS